MNFPFISLSIYYGYSEDGLVHMSLLPNYIKYIIFPLTIVLNIPLAIFLLTGLAASIYDKKLSRETLLIGTLLLLIMILGIVISRALRGAP